MEYITPGPYQPGSTNMEIAPDYANIGDAAMHEYLQGMTATDGRPQYLADVLRYPESAWTVDVPVPDTPALYGPASGLTLPVASFVVYPAAAGRAPNRYVFPYENARYGVFEDMLKPGESPQFASATARYPLVIISHGFSAHGIYDVRHAYALASHGYIVVVPNYGDERSNEPGRFGDHVGFLRPLLTKAVVDSLLASETFGPHIDAGAIGITGHSMGGFTALALGGGAFRGQPDSVTDPRITAGVIAAPWVGDANNPAFGADNSGLDAVRIPVISLYGTLDEATPAATILPAMKQLPGPTYVVELVDQPHVFEDGSWQDRDNWELLFFKAYLDQDASALEMLKSRRSSPGGNNDVQHFDYQRAGQPAARSTSGHGALPVAHPRQPEGR